MCRKPRSHVLFAGGTDSMMEKRSEITDRCVLVRPFGTGRIIVVPGFMLHKGNQPPQTMAIELTTHSAGTILPVRAQPGAKRTAIVGEQAGALKVAVTEKPEGGKATAAIAEVIADSLGIAKSRVELLSGASSRQKRFVLRDLPLDVVQTWLDQVANTSA